VLNWDDFLSDSGTEDVPLVISTQSQSLILAALELIQSRNVWDDGTLDDANWDDIDTAIANALDDIMYEEESSTSVTYAPDNIPATDPTLQTWTALNQGNGTFTEDTTNKRLTIIADGDGATKLRGWTMPAPSTPYAATAYIKFAYQNASNNGLALGWRENTSTEMATILHYQNAFTAVTKWTHANLFSANYVAGTAVNPGINWFRISDDSTNRKCFFSCDGIVWNLLHTIGRTDFLTPDQLFFGMFSSTATTFDIGLSLLSFELT